METPIADFVKTYRESGMSRLHMPGPKGQGLLGTEALDITEIAGADALYEADGIIDCSERNASELFETARTCYSTEGSSQCIRAMLYLALLNQKEQGQDRSGERPIVVAARNVHKTMLLAAALLDYEIVWLWQEEEPFALCRCLVTPEQLAKTLEELPRPATAVYVTSPDYLGNVLDIRRLAETAHRFDVPLLVDDAHGAYRKFLPGQNHPMELGADICSDSAHKTLDVLTGGAYLHISKTAPKVFAENAKRALEMFGSTSPSYLILQSLDLENRILADGYPEKLQAFLKQLAGIKKHLQEAGWQLIGDEDPLKITIETKKSGWNGIVLAQKLRTYYIECEFADPEYVVLMLTPSNSAKDLRRMEQALLACGNEKLSADAAAEKKILFAADHWRPETVCTPREALFAPAEWVPCKEALGRVLAAPSVGCPPAVPIAVSGERIDETAIFLFAHYGIENINVIRQR